MLKQYDIFANQPYDEMQELRTMLMEYLKRLEAVEESTGKVRRKVFAETMPLKKICLENDERLKILEKNICLSKNL